MDLLEWVKIAGLFGGGFLTVATILWNINQRELRKKGEELLAWGREQILVNRQISDKQFQDIITIKDQHYDKLINEVHRRIDNVQGETQTLLRGTEVDMALLKFKTDHQSDQIAKLDTKIDTIMSLISEVNNNINKMSRSSNGV